MKKLMCKLLKIFFIAIFMVMTLSTINAQNVISGIVKNESNNMPLVFATVFIKGTTIGTTTDNNGAFKLEVKNRPKYVYVKFIGFKTKIIETKFNNDNQANLGEIFLIPESIGLNEIEVFSDIAIDRKTPVAVSTIGIKKIEKELGLQDFPEIMKNAPGVYTTRQGGGYGDSRINIRGFDQKNIAVLINGIPVNEMEQQEVYWSNWAGLTNDTRTIQVQRGLGASKLAINSVGGTINIITKTTDTQKGGSFQQSFTDYGLNKTVLSLSTGLMENNMAVNFSGSHTYGNGYIDATQVNAWSYFLSVSKQINKKHQLILTLFGTPQTHGQRSVKKIDMMTNEIHDKYGVKYNRDWGYLDGKMLNRKEHFYHKPQIALNHYWKISDKTFLSSSFYASIGYGKGANVVGHGYYKYNVDYTDDGRQINWNIVRDINATNVDTLAARENNWYQVINNDTVFEKESVQIFRNSCHNHKWIGLLSTLNYDINDYLKLIAGVDVRLYKGIHYEEVRDLFGGDYWDDTKNIYKNQYYDANLLNRSKHAKVGDKINYNYLGYINYYGGFSQIEYTKNNFSTFLAVSAFLKSNKRKDLFSYFPENNETNWQNFLGYNAKTGLNFNINEENNVFANLGYYTKSPTFYNIFINYSNEINKDYKPEKVKAFELGYVYKTENFMMRINAYYTKWDDQWLDATYSYSENNMMKYQNIYFKGLDELHKGVEVEINSKIFNKLSLSMNFSLGDWRYENNVSADVFDKISHEKVGTYKIYTKNLKVYDAPQTHFGIETEYKIIKNIEIGANWMFFDNLYSKFDPTERTNPLEEGIQSYKIPAYNILDMRASYYFKINGLKSVFTINCYNALNEEYISEGYDGINHDENSFVGFWGFKRNFNFSFKMMF
ncbi:MAG: TonB-dependent receptor [Bacteroidales bacterium]|nr:TonB-dependent receptor [Bacteroidales bacterium]